MLTSEARGIPQTRIRTNSLFKMPAAIAHSTDSLHCLIQTRSRKRLGHRASCDSVGSSGAILAVVLGSEMYDVSG